MNLRYARHYVLEEIGTRGQALLESASVCAGAGDARASHVALTYLERAGVTVGEGAPLEVASTDEIARISGRADLVEAAAFLVGAMAATERLAAIAGVDARPVRDIPSLAPMR